ncbi:MAG: Hsp70 family protein [Candidatus Competibacteraceae bacterium]
MRFTHTSHALGIETAGGRFCTLLPANRKTPCEARQIFTSDTDNASRFDINIYQGASPWVRDNALIGTLAIADLPRRPRGALDIEVIFKVSQQQVLSVAVQAEGMRKAATLRFT